MTNSILSNVITSALWTAAICHVLTDRMLRPFALSILAALVDEPALEPVTMPTDTAPITPTPVVVEPVLAAVKSPRPARRRKATTTVAA